MSVDKRYTTLDAMRGVAALGVGIYHYTHDLRHDNFPGGYLAVDIFFMLSGFVIALNYHDRLLAGLSSFRFMVLRTIRLYPTYFCGFVASLVFPVKNMLIGVATYIPPKAILLSSMFALFLLPSPPFVGGPAVHPLFLMNAPSWSLFMEYVVNLLFCTVLVRLPSQALVVLALGAAAVTVPYVKPPDFLALGWNWGNVIGGFGRTMFAFPVGVLVWRHAPLDARRASWLALLPVIVVTTIMAVHVPDERRAVFDLVVAIAAFPVLLTIGVLCDLPAAIRRPFTFLGDISYAFYAIHAPLILPFTRGLQRIAMPQVLREVLVIGVIVAIAAVITYRIDPPARRWLTAQWQRRQVAA